jgi:dihydroflavonol-4-reductase
LLDRASLEQALEDCDVLFHIAASYTFWAPHPEIIYQTNFQGTENILTVARDRGIRKVVYTSTEATIGIQNGDPGTEAQVTDPDNVPGHYKKTKCMAESLALKMCQAGVPVVVVNPTMPVGTGDIKPTPTGQFIVDWRRVVSVRDISWGTGTSPSAKSSAFWSR